MRSGSETVRLSETLVLTSLKLLNRDLQVERVLLESAQHSCALPGRRALTYFFFFFLKKVLLLAVQLATGQ